HRTHRWSERDSNLRFRARYSMASRLVRVGADRSYARRLSRAVAARSTYRVRGRPFEEPQLTLDQAARPRGGALSAMRAHRGTEGSNPVPSSAESATNQFPTKSASAQSGGNRGYGRGSTTRRRRMGALGDPGQRRGTDLGAHQLDRCAPRPARYR